jgi:hypothetical protein
MDITYLKRHKNAFSRLVSNETVIVQLPKGQMVVLNNSASVIWSLADGNITKDEIIAKAGELISGATPENLEVFINELVEKELLDTSPSASPCENDAMMPQIESEDAPIIKTSEPLETLAGICDSAHSGGMTCMTSFETCGMDINVA